MILASLTGRMTFREFLDAVESVEGYSEYVNGVARPLAGTTLRHGLIVSHLLLALADELNGGNVQLLGLGVAVKPPHADNAFFPDVKAYVSKPEALRHGGVDLLLNPVMIAEVVSPATADFDRGTKWENYRRIPSLREYLVFSQDCARVEQYTRHGEHVWLFSETEGLDAEIRIESLNVVLALAQIYRGVTLGTDEDDEAPAE